MERIKDILYDISDIVLSLIIVALIFAVVSFKISDAMSLDKLALPHTTSETPKKTQPAPNTSQGSTTAQPANGSTAQGAEVVTVNVDSPSGNTMTTDAKPASTNATPSGTPITLDIKSGASGYSIAKLLKDQGLIQDVNTFIKRVEEKKAGTKLRSGTFKFTSGMTLDEVIKVLTGK